MKKATAPDGEAAVKELLKAGKLKIDEKGAVETVETVSRWNRWNRWNR